MAVRRRKVEVHRLTVSGLEKDVTYGRFLRDTRRQMESLRDAVLDVRGKSHALYDARITGGRTRLLFISFRSGYRPDILDVADYSLAESPLEETETGVEWTHCLGGLKRGKYILLVEKGQGGIWPRTIQHYLQWMVDSAYAESDEDEEMESEGIVINLEPVADESFIERVEALDRVRQAMVRIVRPNPGWHDLETELSEQSAESDAARADITMHARRRRSLERDSGIVAAIRQSVIEGELDYARIEGEREGATEKFDTASFGRSEQLEFDLDSYGQVRRNDAWAKLGRMFNRLG